MIPGPDGRLLAVVVAPDGPVREALRRAVAAHPLLVEAEAGPIALVCGDAEPPPGARLRVDLGPGEGVPVLPEGGPERVYRAARLRAPGAIATALALALLPLEGRVAGRVPAFAVSGALRGPVPVGPYRVLDHPDTNDVARLVSGVVVDLVPFAAPVGTALWVAMRLPPVPIALWTDFYAGNPLVEVVDRAPAAAEVEGTPKAVVGVVGDPGATAVIVALDRLGRGSAAQAVALLNLAMGWPLDLGLR